MTAIDTRTTAELDRARIDVLDKAGWGRPFVFFQPRNAAFWIYLLLVLTGLAGIADQLGGQIAAYGPAVALAVALFTVYGAIFWWFTQRIDRYAKLPAALLVLAFLWGGFAATWALAATANDAIGSLYAKTLGQAWSLDWGAALSAPITEELSKGAGLILLLALAPRLVRTAFDGFILGAFIGLGFEILEDISYVIAAAGARFGADPVAASMETIWVRLISGVAAHILYSAIFCAGIIYLLGRPAEPRRIGRGIILILIPVLLHGLWDGTQAIAGANPLTALALILGQIVVALLIVVRVFDLTIGRQREIMRAVMAPEVARDVITAAELEALAGNRTARRAHRRAGGSRADRRRARWTLHAAFDLSSALADSRGADTAEVRFARGEVRRIRSGEPSRW
ncbi:MAG: PrsW family intramembrane metalloprotease [Mycobacterium sp.]|uniref:PrsW family intramembrane metalloprotease n=1 Tax=Mycolicibacterium poriferae TaxID=39694 RepID=UPI0024B9979E|nr:PrsW family glutamic-type intramembrane protease [Mycolicibacterium poriferae]MCK5756687.1 PrsW family intramembrane metalloprotease [Mycobacterium sp.]